MVALPVSASSWLGTATVAGVSSCSSALARASMLEAGVGRGSAGLGAGCWTVDGSGVGCTDGCTLSVLCTWVATGVGNCAVTAGSSAAIEDSGSGCAVCASTTGGVGSGAAGLGAAAAGAGLRRAALGANFLPVVFSTQSSASPVVDHVRRSSLLMKELVKAAGAGLAD